MTSSLNMNINVRRVDSMRLLQYDAARRKKRGTWGDIDWSVEDLVRGSGSVHNKTHVEVANTNSCWKELFWGQRKVSEEKNYCDVRLFTDTEQGYIAVHSLMLLGKSKFLDEAIKDNLQTSIPTPKNEFIGITLTGVSLDHLKAVMTILYCGKCVIDPRDENDIRVILDLLQIGVVETDKSVKVKKKKQRWVKITRKDDGTTETGNGVNTGGVPSATGGLGSDVHATDVANNDVNPASAEVPGGNAKTRERLQSQSSETQSENMIEDRFMSIPIPHVEKVQPRAFIKKPTERIRRHLSDDAERPPSPQPGPSSRAYEAQAPNQVENIAEPIDPLSVPLPEIRKITPSELLQIPQRPRIQRRLPSPPNIQTSRRNNDDNNDEDEEEDTMQSKSKGPRFRSRYEEDNDYIPSPSPAIEEEEELEELDIEEAEEGEEEEEEESDISRPTSRSTRSRSSSGDGARKRYPKRKRPAKGSYIKMLNAAEEENTRVLKSKRTNAKEKYMPPVETGRCLRARRKRQRSGTTSDAYGAADKDSASGQLHNCPSCEQEFLELDEFEFHLSTSCTKSFSEMYKLRSNFCGICQVSFKELNPTEFMQHVWDCVHSGKKLSKRGKQLTEGSIKTNRTSKGTTISATAAAAAAAAAATASAEPVVPQSELQEPPAHVEASSSGVKPRNSTSTPMNVVSVVLPEARVYVERLEMDRIPSYVVKFRKNKTISRPPLSEKFTYFFKLRDENDSEETLQGQPTPTQLETVSTTPAVEFAVPLPPAQPTHAVSQDHVGSSIPVSHSGETNVSAFVSSQLSTTFDPQFASTPNNPQQPTGKVKRGKGGYRPGPKSRTKRQKFAKGSDLAPASVAENRETLDQPDTISDGATATTTTTIETAPPPPSRLDIINTALKLRKSLKERGRKDSCENPETQTVAAEKKVSQEKNTASVAQRESTAVNEINKTIMLGNERATPMSTLESSSANIQPPEPVVSQISEQELDPIEREMQEMFEDSDQSVSGQAEPVEHLATTTTHQATPMPSFNDTSLTDADILLQSLTAADVEDRMTPRTYARTTAPAQVEGQIFGNINTITESLNQTLVGGRTASVSTDPPSITSSPSTLTPSPAQSQQGHSSFHQSLVAPLPDNTVTAVSTIQELLATSPGVPENFPPLALPFGPRPAAQQTPPSMAMNVSASNASALMPPPQSFPSRGGPTVNRQHYLQQANHAAPRQSEVINRLMRQNVMQSQPQTLVQPNALIPVTRGQHFPNGNMLGGQQQQQSPFEIMRVDGISRPSRPGTPIVGSQQRHALIDQRQQIVSTENGRLQQQSLQSHFRVNPQVPTTFSQVAQQVQNVNRASPQNVLQQQQQQQQQQTVHYQNPQQLQQRMSYQTQQQQPQIQSSQEQMQLAVHRPTPPPNQAYFQQRQPQQLASYRPSYRVRVNTPPPPNFIQVQPSQHLASGMQQQRLQYNTLAASTPIAQSQAQVQLSSSGTSTIVSIQQPMVSSTLTQPTSNVPARVFNSGHGNLHVTSLPQNSRTPTPPVQRQSGLVRLPATQFNPFANRATSPVTQQRPQVFSLPNGGAPNSSWQNSTSPIPAPPGVNNAVVTRGENSVSPVMPGGLAQASIRCDGCGLGFLTQQHLSDHLDTGLC